MKLAQGFNFGIPRLQSPFSAYWVSASRVIGESLVMHKHKQKQKGPC